MPGGGAVIEQQGGPIRTAQAEAMWGRGAPFGPDTLYVAEECCTGIMPELRS